MSARRFFLILVIFGAVSLAWMILGTSMVRRTADLQAKLSPEMESLWGPKTIVQPAPYWAPAADAGRDASEAVAPGGSAITAAIRHENRPKGLLWFSAFAVDFDGRYVIAADEAGRAGDGWFILPLPAGVGQYDERPTVTLDGEPMAVPPAAVAAGRVALPVHRGSEHVVTVRYTTRGQDRWLYAPGDIADSAAPTSRRFDLREAARELGVAGDGELDRTVPTSAALAELRNFSLTVRTDFRAIDYPPGTRSPNEPASADGGGMIARWTAEDALTKQAMGIDMPRRTNAGPVVYRMTYFAPMSLGFFFTVLFTVVVLKKIPLHPMHYLFVSAGFFAFHILLAYLADLMNDIHLAFGICAAVSVLLVISYMRLVAGVKFAVLFVGAAQLLYLVGFSYAFFWVGKTGLTVTIGAILTLFVLMQTTGRIDWREVFRHTGPLPPPIPPADRQTPAVQQ